MTKPKVFITRQIPAAGLDLIRAECEVDLWSGELPPLLEEINRRVVGVDGILSLLTDPISSRDDGPGRLTATRDQQLCCRIQ